ncbi:DUF4767 domain-containing protein [Streptococcus cameli]
MKKRWYYVLLALSLFILSACGSRLKDGVYEDTKNGYQLIVDGENVALKALIATGEGTIKGNTFEIETSLLGLTSKTQKLTYRVKGDTVEVKDEEGNLMVFKRTDQKVTTDSWKTLFEDVEVVNEEEEVGEDSPTSDSSKKTNESDVSVPTSLHVADLSGTWQNAVGDRWEITNEGQIRSDSQIYRFKGLNLDENGTEYAGPYSQELLNADGSVVAPNGMGFLFLPAGLAAKGVEDQTDIGRDRFYIANNGGQTWFQEKPEWIFYRVASDQTVTTGKERWNQNKSQQLAAFMVDWGNSMGQPGYKKVTDQGDLFWQGSDWQNRMDVTYSETGVSDSEFTIVATYVYQRDINLVHRYHFALRQDGSPVVFYSENNRMQPPQGAPAEVKWANFFVSKETANEDLKNGFATIVRQ